MNFFKWLKPPTIGYWVRFFVSPTPSGKVAFDDGGVGHFSVDLVETCTFDGPLPVISVGAQKTPLILVRTLQKL